MHARHEPSTGTGLNGLDCTFAVDDLDAVGAAVVANGGTITMDQAAIPSVGVLTRFIDTEGNAISAMRYEASHA